MSGLPKELWIQISTDNPTTYYKLLQTSKVFKLDTDTMKTKFVRETEVDGDIYYRLPNNWRLLLVR